LWKRGQRQLLAGCTQWRTCRIAAIENSRVGRTAACWRRLQLTLSANCGRSDCEKSSGSNGRYAPRKETVERSFADAKELHGHRYARFSGLAKVQAQCLLSTACQNMKKMALVLARKAKKETEAALLRLYQTSRSAHRAFKTAAWPKWRFGISFHCDQQTSF
jgi:hypothetical protein